MSRLFSKLIILAITTSTFFGCSGTKAFKNQKPIIDRIEVYEENRLLKNNPVNFIITTTTNKKIFGIPVGKILYEMSHPEPKKQFSNWIDKKQNRRKRLKNWISNKQILALSNYGENFNKWLKKTGEPPSILDTLTLTNSKKRIIQYYKNLGYYDVQVKAQKYQINKNEIILKYYIKPNERYLIDSLNYTIQSSGLDSILKENQNEQIIKKGDPFEINKFEAERERLFLLFRNNGIYNFRQNSIQFTAAIDSTGQDLKIPVNVRIENIRQRINDTLIEIPYSKYRIKDIAVYVNNANLEDNSSQYSDSIFYNNLNIFSKGKLKYRPKTITSGISIKAGEFYSDKNRNLTYRYFTNLKNFKYPSINYSLVPGEKNALNASIFLNPKERFSLGFDVDLSHSNIQDFGIGLGGGLGIRNVFRGAELLELNIKNTLGASRDIAQKGDQFFNLYELGADLKLSIPKLLIPWINKNWASSSTLGKTEIILGTSLQENIGLDKQFFKGVYQFDISSNSKKRIQFKLIDLEFVNNRNLSNYFNVYKNSYDRLNQIAKSYNTNENIIDSSGSLLIPEGTSEFIEAVLNNRTNLNFEDQDFRIVNTVKERFDRLSANNLILGSSFSLNLNSQESIFDEKFYQFRWKLDWIGNLLNQFLTNFSNVKNEDNQNVLGGVSPSQYIKTEIDYIKHWPFGRERVFALHGFAGIAIPFGNSTNMPFSRSYFSGGANDNRAWKAYKLGPGSSRNINEFNEANFKIAFNLEYRFRITGPIKGGLFIDLGNVWNIFDDVEDPDMRFDGLEDFSEIAIGSGFGLRYDFDFFVFRFDTGFKTYNPALPEGDRWWNEFNFKNAVFNIGINYPF
jgi:outer membrane protein assembly factor BamA